MATRELHWADYLVFVCLILFSSGIGIFYACTGTKQRTKKEFLMANRDMNVIPITLSLLASFMSAITLLGTPAEMYQFGTQYWVLGFSYIIVGVFATHVILPVLYRLELTSVYEYLERRFNQVVRIQGTLTFILQMIIYMGIVLYAPSLAIAAVTGINWWISVLVLGVVCTFYTTIGGIKAVMWTDVLQITVMFCGMVAIVVVGTIKVGSFSEVQSRSNRSTHGLEFSDRGLDYMVGRVRCESIPSPTILNRSLTTTSSNASQSTIWLNVPGLWALLTVCALSGVVAFAYYVKQGCDPLISGQIKTADQILPIFVMDVLNYPGFPGLFIATIFSGALSTISSGLNSLAAVLIEDIIQPIYLASYDQKIPEERGATLSKIIAASFGVLSIVLAFLASVMGDTLQAALGLFGMVGGPLLGLFLLGILFPCVNWQGACIGHVAGLSVSLWFGFGALFNKPPVYRPPVPVGNCSHLGIASYNASALYKSYIKEYTENGTFLVRNADFSNYDALSIYRMSYMWQGFWAVLWTIIVGLITSAIFGFQPKGKRDPNLSFPTASVLCCCLPANVRKMLQCGTEEYLPDGDIVVRQGENDAGVMAVRPASYSCPSPANSSAATLSTLDSTPVLYKNGNLNHRGGPPPSSAFSNQAFSTSQIYLNNSAYAQAMKDSTLQKQQKPPTSTAQNIWKKDTTV